VNTPASRNLLDDIGLHFTTAGHLAGPAVEATPILLGLLSAAVAIGIAVTGWKLARHWRRRDNQRADLTEVAQLLRRIQVQIQLLADQDTVATATDCQELRALKYELAGADTSFAPDAAGAITEVIKRLDALLDEAPASTGTGTVVQARAQGRAVQAVLAAITAAQAVISRLRRQ
jgi:2-methylisocitrate lyase-like PEP mutase family enzyme